MSRLFAVALLLASSSAFAGEPLPADAPEMMPLKSYCQVCHTLQYVTQQRLTPAQWKKTVEKMVKFGAPVPTQDMPSLIAFLAAHLTPELADAPPVRVAPPDGALPKGAKRK